MPAPRISKAACVNVDAAVTPLACIERKTRFRLTIVKFDGFAGESRFVRVARVCSSVYGLEHFAECVFFPPNRFKLVVVSRK